MSNKQTCNISIELGFEWPPENPSGFPGTRGGIRIIADGESLTKRVDKHPQPDASEREFNKLYDKYGRPIDVSRQEFINDTHYGHLPRIQDAFMPILEGKYERYREYPAELRLGHGDSVVIFSPIDGERIRMAIQPIDFDTHDCDRPTKALVGVPIDPKDLCRELIPCYEQCIEYIKKAYGDVDADLSDDIDELEADFRGRIATLESYLD